MLKSETRTCKDLSHVTVVPTHRPFRVSVEGNIGSGKSSLIKYFSKFPGIETYPEPIELWRNCNGHNLLEHLYSDVRRWVNPFQTYVQLTRLKIQTSVPKPTTRVQLFERSLQNNRFCFLEHAYVNDFISRVNYDVLACWYKFIAETKDIRLDLIVYLRSSPEVVYERIKARGRPEEAELDFKYIKELHLSHERWLMRNDDRYNTIPVVVLDADQCLSDIEEEYRKNEKEIMGMK